MKETLGPITVEGGRRLRMELPNHSSIKSGEPIRAAEYVRMSTERQEYSTQNQHDAIRQWAQTRNRCVVRTYVDEARSGLRIKGRAGLQQLLRDVESGQTDFTEVLVYDVSRWGRFQDIDESAHYEYLCRRAHIAIHYCAEPFENDGTQISSMLKGMKRLMAAEYSRELSAKVFRGQCQLIRLGFRQGGSSGYALRRQLQDQNRTPKLLLAHGDRKSILTDRVILVPGPSEEVKVVEHVYRMFVEASKSEIEIARELNEQGLRTDRNRRWTWYSIHQLLTSEKYIGNNVYNRISTKLKTRRVFNRSDLWVRQDQAFAAIVPKDLFERAQEIFRGRHHVWSNDELLEKLSQLLARERTLSARLINATTDMPWAAVYRARFHGLACAYRLIGYTPERGGQYIETVETNRRLRLFRAEFLANILGRLQKEGATIERCVATDLFTINCELTVAVAIARCGITPVGAMRWWARLRRGVTPDVTILVRMDAENRQPSDYYLLPLSCFHLGRLTFTEENKVGIDAYRFTTLDFLIGMARRARLVEAL